MSKKLDEKIIRMLDKRRDARKAGRRYARRVLSRCKAMFPDVLGSPDTSLMADFMAELLALGCHQEHILLYEWTAEKFWAKRVGAQLADFHRLFSLLSASHVGRKKRFVYNDLDSKAWVEPHKSRKVIVFDDNGRLYIAVYEEDCIGVRLHVRRLAHRTTYVAKIYLNRPSLAYFREHDFKVEYGDCRDHGYVFSYEEMVWMEPKVERAFDHTSDIEHFLFLINTTLVELEDKAKET